MVGVGLSWGIFWIGRISGPLELELELSLGLVLGLWFIYYLGHWWIRVVWVMNTL